MSDETSNCASDEYLDQLPHFIPSTPPGIWSYVCLSLRVPYHPTILAALMYYISRLNFECAWSQDDPRHLSAADTAQAMKQMYAEMEVTSCMIGTLVPFVTTDVPSHLLLCDGATHNRADYPLLYNVLDAQYIIDADTFRTPDMTDVMMLGAGSRSVGDIGGAEEHTLTVAEMPSHTHTYQQFSFGIDVEAPGVPDPTGVGQPELPRTTSSSGNGQPHNNMPPYHVVYIGIVAR